MSRRRLVARFFSTLNIENSFKIVEGPLSIKDQGSSLYVKKT
jgi:hypothetical protein